MKLGIDISTYIEELNSGAKYYKDGKLINPLEIFENQGITYYRIRVWNDPFKGDKPYLGGTNDISKYLLLASIAKKYNAKIILDFHYSDFWADPGKQMTPKAWKGYSFEEVEQAVYDFTKRVLNISKEYNIEIDYIQVGNEITNGMIWPYGKLDESVSPRGNYDSLAKLLKSGIKACKEVYQNAQIIIHLERSYDQKIYAEYFDNIISLGVDFDIIGMSYYPYWHGNFVEFFGNVNMCQNRYKKDIMVMELGYGFTLEDYILNSNGETHLVINEANSKEMLDKLPFPISKAGQASFIKEFLRLAKLNNIKMVVYWEPLWIPGDNICWSSLEGQEYINEVGKSFRNEWANQCLFDYEGNANPALDYFKIEE